MACKRPCRHPRVDKHPWDKGAPMQRLFALCGSTQPGPSTLYALQVCWLRLSGGGTPAALRFCVGALPHVIGILLCLVVVVKRGYKEGAASSR